MSSRLTGGGAGRTWAVGVRAVSRRLLAVRRWWQHQSLARQFALAAFAIILPGTLATGYWVGERIKQGVAESSAASAYLYVDHVVSPIAQRLDAQGQLAAQDAADLDRALAPLLGKRLTSFNIWTLDGRIAYSSRKELIGRQFPPTALFHRARKGQISAEFEGHPHAGDAYDRTPTMRLEIYAPIHGAGSDTVVAVAELYSIREGLAAELRRATRLSWLVVGAIGATMMSALSGIVFRGSRTIEHQGRQLRAQIQDLQRLLDQNAELSGSLQRARHRTVAINEQQLRRVGADLHDGPAQMIGLALLLLDTDGPADAADTAALGPAPQIVATATTESRGLVTGIPGVRSALTEALRDIRAISTGLVMPDVADATLEGVVRQVARDHERRTGSPVTVSIGPGVDTVPLSLNVCAYRLLQEALTNSWRHAGGKGQSITIRRDKNVVKIVASDQGPGLRFPAAHNNFNVDVESANRWTDATREARTSRGVGLVGLRDRVETLGGGLELVSTATGTTLTATFDIAEVERLAKEQN